MEERLRLASSALLGPPLRAGADVLNASHNLTQRKNSRRSRRLVSSRASSEPEPGQKAGAGQQPRGRIERERSAAQRPGELAVGADGEQPEATPRGDRRQVA